jgi:glutamine amidotransferase-like uncharacterized protein
MRVSSRVDRNHIRITGALLLGIVTSVATLYWQVDQAMRTGTVDPDGNSDVLEGISTDRPTGVAMPAVGILVLSDEDKSECVGLQRILQNRGINKVSIVRGDEVKTSGMGAIDVVLVPGGGAGKKVRALGHVGLKQLQKFVRDGGGYVGICGGAFLALSDESRLGLVNAFSWRGTVQWPGGGSISLADRGAGKVTVELSDDGIKCFPRCPRYLHMDYAGGPVFLAAHRHDLSGFATLACFRSEISAHEADAGSMVNTPAILMAKYGAGRVMLFSPHPEAEKDDDQMVADAVIVVAAHRNERR